MAILHKLKQKRTYYSVIRIVFWFFLGATLGLFFFIGVILTYYRVHFGNRIYPGVFISGVDFSGKTEREAEQYFTNRNEQIGNSTITLQTETHAATVSASQLKAGFDADLLAQQAYSIGKSKDLASNMSLLLRAYLYGVYLPPSYHYDEDAVTELLKPMQNEIQVKPIDAQFTVENGKVTTFKPSSDGKDIDIKKAKKDLREQMIGLASAKTPHDITIAIPIITVEPNITTEKANNLGIDERIGVGTSVFVGSIPNRIYNVTLAATRLNGILVAPGEMFSFAKALGDVSSFTGYKQAYVIQNGRTVLGDGGGVCQVSTTLFRAILNAGLPITERHPHAYRVHYYEEDSLPGIDAAVYIPTVDLKFKNDTKHSILIQSFVDQQSLRLTFELYGTSDGRVTTVSKPVILSQSPAPEPLYQDDPTLPKGEVKQVDFSAPGARVFFTREVKRDGKVILSDRFDSNYRPWQAIFMKGTKE